MTPNDFIETRVKVKHTVYIHNNHGQFSVSLIRANAVMYVSDYTTPEKRWESAGD